jgi:hypothetical protein
VLAGVIITIGTQVLRLTTGFGGIPVSMSLANSVFMIVLSVGAAWLVVRSARMGWLTLLLALVLIPLPWMFAVTGIASGWTQMVQLFLAAVIGFAIVAAGRPRERY